MAEPITTAELVAPPDDEATPAESASPERGRTAAGG